MIVEKKGLQNWKVIENVVAQMQEDADQVFSSLSEDLMSKYTEIA